MEFGASIGFIHKELNVSFHIGVDEEQVYESGLCVNNTD